MIYFYLAQEKFKKVSIAYRVLSDPGRRRQYDAGESEASDFEGLDISELGSVGMFYNRYFFLILFIFRKIFRCYDE